MSFNSVILCIRYAFANFLKNSQVKKSDCRDCKTCSSVKLMDDEELARLPFKDISDFLPSEYFLLEKEPLYAFSNCIKNGSVCLMVDNNSDVEILLKELFVKKDVGQQQVPFSAFWGVTNSREDGKVSFASFKCDQYKRSKLPKSEYIEYDCIKKDVFSKDRYDNTNCITNAIRLEWSKKVYAENRDRSHRFALLCEWDRVENKKDYYSFNVTEISINEARKKEFLESYYGFLVHSETVSAILNFSLVEKKDGCTLPHDNLACLILQKGLGKDSAFNILSKKDSCIFVNPLLERKSL